MNSRPRMPPINKIGMKTAVREYVAGLIGSGDRKSVQPMAERLAPGNYDQLHHFVAAGVWDAAPLEKELLVQADKLVGGSDAVLVIDDTAVPKKGKHSVGVAWQYASALGKSLRCRRLRRIAACRGGPCRGPRGLPEQARSCHWSLVRRDGRIAHLPNCGAGELCGSFGRAVGALKKRFGADWWPCFPPWNPIVGCVRPTLRCEVRSQGTTIFPVDTPRPSLRSAALHAFTNNSTWSFDSVAPMCIATNDGLCSLH